MKCEICKQNEATISINHKAGETSGRLHICESCAAAKGLNLHVAVPLLTNLLMGMGPQKGGKSQEVAEKVCPHCRTKLSEFRKTSLLGCPECYEAFQEEVAGFLESMQKGDSHVGKIPSVSLRQAEIQKVQQSMQEAVRAQDYEAAARLRDRMQELRNARATVPTAGRAAENS